MLWLNRYKLIIICRLYLLLYLLILNRLLILNILILLNRIGVISLIRIAISLLALFDWDEGGILWNLRSNLRVFIRDILNLLSLLRLKRLESLDSLRLRRLREGLKLRLRLILKLILSLWLIYWLNLWLELTLIFDLPWNLGLNRWPLNLLDITVRILKKLLIFAQLAVLIFLSFYFFFVLTCFFQLFIDDRYSLLRIA